MKPTTTPNPEYPVLGPVLETIKKYEAATGSRPYELAITTDRYNQLKADCAKLPAELHEIEGMPDTILGVRIIIDVQVE